VDKICQKLVQWYKILRKFFSELEFRLHFTASIILSRGSYSIHNPKVAYSEKVIGVSVLPVENNVLTS
jgi:hypothetical protein